MEHRDRAAGWKYAKLSGHSNEERIRKAILEDVSLGKSLLAQMGLEDQIVDCRVGGLHETDVESVYEGRKTKSKTDLTLRLASRGECRISIKKSRSGQVYLIRDARFLEGFSLQYGRTAPPAVQRAVALFWGSAADTMEIVNACSGFYSDYERHKHRLVAQTLYQYDPSLADTLLDWFRENLFAITDFCFARGLAKYPEDWAEWIWYRNMVGEKAANGFYSIQALCAAAQNAAEQVCYGEKNGGTTIQLPFGFVQWHQGQMQFHHQYKKISALLG